MTTIQPPFSNCVDCQTPVGCRISRTCINAAKAKERTEQLANAAPARPAQEAPQPAPEVSEAAAAAVAQSRLCRECKHAVKPMAVGWNFANCLNPANPINLVTGTRVFPCIVARGYDQLCGWIGVRWEHK